MFLNALHMRFAAIGAGIAVFVIFLLSGGSLGNPEVIQIDFSMYPEIFEGCSVEIDGKIVGQLEATGRATRDAFEVKKGKHVVRVLHEEFGSQQIEVEVAKGQKVRLMLEMVDGYDAKTGATTAMIGAYR